MTMRVRHYLGIRALPLMAIMVLSAGIAGCQSVGRTASAVSTSTGAKTHSRPVRILSAGLTGSRGWRITKEGTLDETRDGGRAWVPDALPSHVRAQDVRSVSVELSGRTVIATYEARGVRVYTQSQPGLTWRSTSVVAQWPPGYAEPQQPASVLVSSVGDRIFMAMGDPIGSSLELISLVVSTNGGMSFSQVYSGSGLRWQTMTFLSASVGVVVEGPASSFVKLTDNGGVSWTRVNLPSGFESSTLLAPLALGIDGPLLPAVVQSAGGESVALVSIAPSNGSTTITGTPLRLQGKAGSGLPVVAALGHDVWVFGADGTLERSQDAGNTWSTVETTGLLSGVTSATFSSVAAGSAVVTQSSCLSGKQDCSTTQETLYTSDGGSSWS